MAASYNTDDVNHVTKEVFDSIHDAATPATIDSSTSALLHPKEYYSMRTVHFALAFINLGYAGVQILARVALVDGISQYMFSIYRNLIAFVLIGPLAYYVERSAGRIYILLPSHAFFFSIFPAVITSKERLLLIYLLEYNFQLEIS
jgi:hypothetical protein